MLNIDLLELFPTLLTQEQLPLSANKVLKFVCTVIRNVEFYSLIMLLIKSIDWFKLKNQEGNKSVMHAEEENVRFSPDPIQN